MTGDRAPIVEREEGGVVSWLAHYVYGTIATLVAIAGLTFESNPGELTTALVVIIGAVAIWLAHALSQLVSRRSAEHVQISARDVVVELRSTWSIVSAAIPATVIFVMAGLGVWSISTAFLLADIVGVAALAVVGIATAGGRDRPIHRRITYVVSVVGVGVAIVLLEAGVHLL